MKYRTYRNLLVLTLIPGIVMLAVLLLPKTVIRAAEWSDEPNVNFPNYPGSYTTFLNGGNGGGYKSGSIWIGDPDPAKTSWLCLNSDPTKGTADTIAPGHVQGCISSWIQIAALTKDQFLRRLSLGPTGTLDPTLVDTGYIGVQPNKQLNQHYGLIVESNDNLGAVPGVGALKSLSQTSAHYAGQFNGRTYVESPTPANGKICLNLTDPINPSPADIAAHCTNDWSSTPISGSSPADAVSIKTQTYISPDQGNIGVGGPVVFNNSSVPGKPTGAIIAGLPNALTPVSLTCGDGMCSSSNGETASNCAYDCGP